MPANNLVARLLWSCPDKPGLVAYISKFLFEKGGNIIDLDVHVDRSAQLFFLRVTWEMDRFSVPSEQLHEAFQPLIQQHQAKCKITLSQTKPRVGIMVSKYDHCLQEILWRHALGEFAIDIPVIISNHPDLRPLAERYGIPYHVFAITAENKAEQEEKEIALLKKEKVDTVVLARYMQVLTVKFVQAFPSQIINIHHSFLPAFIGSNPYKQAFERGVKIIGASCHYVTEDLDEGQIIEQDITRISHKDSIEDLIRKGRDLERFVLARGLQVHIEDRVLVHGRKTIVFN